MKKGILFFAATITSLAAVCQVGSDIKLPVVTPPSPEAAAINKN